jgi:hypothetical protein
MFFRKSVHPCLLAKALQLFTKFAAAACPPNLSKVTLIHIASFTPNLRMVWKDCNISPTDCIRLINKGPTNAPHVNVSEH